MALPTQEEFDALIRKSNEIGQRAQKLAGEIDEARAAHPKALTDDRRFVPQYETLISDYTKQRASKLRQQAPFQEGSGHMIRYYVATPNTALPKEVVDFVQERVRNDTKAGAKDPSFTKHSRALPTTEHMQAAIALAVEDINTKMLGTLQLSPTTSPKQAHIIIAASNHTHFMGIAGGNGRIVLLDESSFTGTNPQEEIGTATHEIGHALGLEHPHSYTKNPGGPSSSFIGCARTAMAYYKQCLGNQGTPANTFQDMDISALRAVYPQPKGRSK